MNTILFPEVKADGWEEVGRSRHLRADVVIIGSGPGGSAVAKVLAEAGLKVVVVESGPKQSNFRPNYAHTARYHMQESGSMITRGSTMFPIAAGKGVGGSTLINSALSFRAPDNILDQWATDLQRDEWSAKSMNVVYDEIAQLIGVATTPSSISGKNNDLIVRGIKKLGWDGGLAPRSTPGCIGCGICYFGCPSHGKASSNLTLLPLACRHDCLIQAEVEVTNVIVRNGRAVGIEGIAIDPETKERKGTLRVDAGVVFSAAGAIGTPKLLHFSNLASQLGSKLGEGLHVHPGNTLIGICDEKIEMWKGATQGAYCHPPDLPGVLPHTFSAPPEACLLAAGYIGSRFQEGLALLPYMCGMLVMVSDKGTGRVSSYSDGRAKIEYEFHPGDVDRIKKGLVAVAKILFAGGAKQLMGPIHNLSPSYSVEELEQKLAPKPIQDFTLYAAHPMSSCRMSTSIETGVIKPNGETHGIKNLYIADASTFPTSLGVNPQLSTYAAATQIARMFLDTQ